MVEQPQTLFLVRPIRELFVNRSDTYCVQRSEGYRRIEEPLTDEVLVKHLKGEITIGSYQLSADNLVKWLAFDLDPEKLELPEASARQILKTIFKTEKNESGTDTPRVWRHSVILEASRYPDPSYHIWILFLVPVQARVAKWLGFRVLELANLNPKSVEVFPKQTHVTKERPYGNFVKLPLGLHQTVGKWSCILDHDTFQPVPNSRILDVSGLSFSPKDLAKIEGFELKTGVQSTFKVPEKFKQLSDKEEENAVRFLSKYWKPGTRNRLEMFYLGMCIKQGVSHESAKRVIAEVTRRMHDHEASSRLALVDYHYETRISGPLKGTSGIAEIVQEFDRCE